MDEVTIVRAPQEVADRTEHLMRGHDNRSWIHFYFGGCILRVSPFVCERLEAYLDGRTTVSMNSVYLYAQETGCIGLFVIGETEFPVLYMKLLDVIPAFLLYDHHGRIVKSEYHATVFVVDETISTANAGSSEVYSKQARTIGMHDYLLLKQHPCKVMDREVIDNEGYSCQFKGVDIFSSEYPVEDTVSFFATCEVPHVLESDGKVLSISEDGLANVVTENGDIKHNVKLPWQDPVPIKYAFERGGAIRVRMVSAMGAHQISDLI